jgi:hypothetical protein
MGAKLEAFFEEADKLGGMRAKVKLAMITKLTAKAAASEPDSPDNIKLFEDAMQEVKKAL